MNLELLDPFRKQIPDRVDSTLNLPHVLLSSKKLDTTVGAKDDEYGKAANSIAFNRRGSYIAVGYASGAVGVYDVLSRTLSSLYKHESCVDEGTKGGGGKDGGSIASTSSSKTHDHCVTALSWSRRSRTLLCGSVGSDEVRLVDTTHPFGPEECSIGVQVDEAKDADDDQRSQSPTAFAPQKSKSCSQETSFAKRGGKEHFKKPVALGTAILETKSGEDVDAHPPDRRNLVPADHSTVRRYPSVQFKFPLTVGSSLKVHPKDSCAGHAVLCDGSIAAFWVPKSGFEESTDDDDEKRPKVKIAVVFKSDKLEVTCSAFDPHGERLYAVTKGGRILGFEVGATFGSLSVDVPAIPRLKPSFVIQIPGGASAWQVVISRNGRYLVVNSADASIRLYNTKDLWTTPDEVQKPAQVFQDVVSKVKFASCDVSGDGEYIVGASQGNDTKYELYIWNTATGALMDKLTGANVELYSVAWHPTRSFLAVAASDGLVDIWGPRINWTAFAPDFQALPGNVEYVECEDEFDIVDDQGKGSATNEEYDEEDEDVDIVTIEPVPVFQSDSEDEEDVFHFATQVTKPNLGSTSAT